MKPFPFSRESTLSTQRLTGPRVSHASSSQSGAVQIGKLFEPIETAQYNLPARLTPEKLTELAESSPLRFTGRALRSLEEHSSRHLGTVVALLHALFNRCRQLEDECVSVARVEECGRRVLSEDVQPWIKRIWHRCSADERVVLAIAARLQLRSEWFAVDEFHTVTVLSRYIFDSTRLRQVIDDLTRMRLFEADGRKIRFTFRQLQRWVLSANGGIHGTIFESMQYERLPLALEHLPDLDRELSRDGQRDATLDGLGLDSTTWHRIVGIGVRYKLLSSGNTESATVAAEFLADFLEHIEVYSETPRSVDATGAAWVPASLSAQDSEVEVFVALPHSLLSGERPDALRRLLSYGHRAQQKASEEFDGVQPPAHTIVLACSNQRQLIDDKLGAAPDRQRAIILDASAIREIVLASDPVQAFRSALLSEPEGVGVVNPYRWKGAVRDRLMARSRSLEGGGSIIEMITKSRDNFLICGARRIGKTTLCRQLEWVVENNDRHFIASCSLETLNGYCGDDLAGEVWHLISAAARRSMDEKLAPPASLASQHDLLKWLDRLRTQKRRITVILDEVDVLIAADEKYEVLGALRAASEISESPLRCVLAGWRRVYEAACDHDGPLYNFGIRIQLPWLNTSAAADLVQRPLQQRGLYFENWRIAQERILSVATRQPSFLQCFLHFLFVEAAGVKGAIPLALIQDVAGGEAYQDEVFDTIRSTFDGLELLILSNLAGDGVKRNTLWTVAGREVKGLSPETFHAAIQLLKASSAVSEEAGTIRCLYPVLRGNRSYGDLRDFAIEKLTRTQELCTS